LREHIILDYLLEWRRDREVFECNIYGSIYKKEFIRKCYNKVPEKQSYGEDLLCLLHAIMNCESAAFDPYSGYNYTIRTGSLDHQSSFVRAPKDKITLYEEM